MAMPMTAVAKNNLLNTVRESGIYRPEQEDRQEGSARGGAAPSGARHCPPGLARKNPPCIPPGQAMKYGIGDRLQGDYDELEDWERAGLPRPRRGEAYYRIGDNYIRVKNDTLEVLELFEAIRNVAD
ncbi:MAG: RcnB family protein [Rhodobacteraceae bacterium]|nr:RcnB family protein [Paracoccaceae bacterium]